MGISIAYLLMQMPAPSEVFLSVEVNALISAGIDVKVFCLRSRHPKHDELLIEQDLTRVPIYFFGWLKLFDIVYWAWRSPGVVFHTLALIIRNCWRRPTLLLKSLAILPKSFSVARCVEQNKISILHAAWGHYPAITGYLIKRLIPAVQFTLALGAYDRLMRHPMTVIAAQHAACILTQSEASAEMIRNQWPKSSGPVIVMRRGIDLETIGYRENVSGTGQDVIVSVGRLIRAKGHQHVVEAFAKVRRRLTQTRLVVIGDGDYRSELERLVGALGLAEAVEFAGHLSQTNLFRRLSEASVFVLASHGENLPNSIKEAMAVGVPVISTPTTGLTELVQDGRTGCVVPMEDVEAIADAILRILTDKAYAGSLIREAKHTVQQRFDIRNTTEKRKALYYDLTHTTAIEGAHQRESA